MISDAIGITANLFNLVIIAFVIYKSSKQIRQDMTILDAMINKIALKQEKEKLVNGSEEFGQSNVIT